MGTGKRYGSVLLALAQKVAGNFRASLGSTKICPILLVLTSANQHLMGSKMETMNNGCLRLIITSMIPGSANAEGEERISAS